MRKIFLFTALAAFAVTVNAQTKPVKTKAAVKPAAEKNLTDSFSYAAGMNIAQNMIQAGFADINTTIVAQAMNDVFNKKPTKMTTDQANMTLQQKLMAFQQKKNDEAKAVCAAYMADNAKKPGMISLPNGLQYEVIKAGEEGGVKPTISDTVVVNYKGTLTDGKEFDNSFKRGEPVTFPLTGVIRGWTEILQHMTKNSYWKVYIPGDLAYGQNPPPGSGIPPNAILVFEIQLLDIKQGPPAPIR